MTADTDEQLSERVAERRVVRRYADMAKLMIDLSEQASNRIEARIDTPGEVYAPLEVECEFTFTITDREPDGPEVGE